MRILGADTIANPFGSSAGGLVKVGYGATNLIFTPNANKFGTSLITYQAGGPSGTNSGLATVIVYAPPQVSITNIVSGLRTTQTAFSVSGIARDWDGTVSNVKLFTNGVQYGSAVTPSNNTFSFSVSGLALGYYTLTTVATDNQGIMSTSAPVEVTVYSSSPSPNLPIAVISNLLPTVTNSYGVQFFVPALVREGLTNLTGTARDPDGGDPVAYRVALYRPDNSTNMFANLTTGTLNGQGFRVGSVTSGWLSDLDFTTIPNGTYELRLTVRGGTDEVWTNVTIAIESDLKIGQYGFSEQDLVIPVNGIPLTVVRTYNSFNTVQGDFGYNWTYALNDMDVVIDEDRATVPALSTLDGNEALDATTINMNVRTGGGRNVTLTMPDGTRATFRFTYGRTTSAEVCPGCVDAQWEAPPGVFATLRTPSPATFSSVGDNTLIPLGQFGPVWQAGGLYTPMEAFDFPSLILSNRDGTIYEINRDLPGQSYPTYVVPDSGYWNSTIVNPYIKPHPDKPRLTKITQRTGDSVVINSTNISHYAPGAGTPTRTVTFQRDAQGRIFEVRDPLAGSVGLASLKYIYNDETGNLIQVLKLVDRTTGAYLTNRYRYDLPKFPHYITSIEDARGIPVARNNFDDAGRLISVQDPDGNVSQFSHNLASRTEEITDRLGRTSALAYDTRGNVTATTNTVGGVKLAAYDALNNKTNEIAVLSGQPYSTNRFFYSTNGLLQAAINPLGYTNSVTYDQYGHITSGTDARNNSRTNFYDNNTGNLLSTKDSLGSSVTNFYASSGLLIGSCDAVGTRTTNYFDGAGNLTSTAAMTASGITLITNSFAYDLNGNRTNAITWRNVNGTWTGTTTAYVYDAANRLLQTIDPEGTNSSAYSLTGRPLTTTDKLGRLTRYDYDAQDRLIRTTYPDLTTESSAFDTMGNQTNSVDQAGKVTTFGYDGLNRVVLTIDPGNLTNRTEFDDLGRARFTVDSRGITNAFGYDVADRCVVVTNGWGTGIAVTTQYGLDANGNQAYLTNALGRITTNTFDALNRLVQVLSPDGTKMSAGFDIGGRRVAETNQDSLITLLAFDGGRLTIVTNAVGKPEQAITRHVYDEDGNRLQQIDALGRTNRFSYDFQGRRTAHWMPDTNLVERFSYDSVGNLAYYTNFNGAVVTNQYDAMNRLTNQTSVNGYKVSFAYNAVDQRTNMTDGSGSTTYVYDNQGRLTNKVVLWASGPTISLNYRFDANGNLTNLWSGSSGGVSNVYQFDSLNRLTNVLANNTTAVGYGYDNGGNLQIMRYGNGLTNQFQYDSLNRLTNAVWKLNASALASFSYQLGLTGNRTNLGETVNGTSRTYAWTFDSLYRLKQEALSGGTSGTLNYGLDLVGNRTNRTVTGGLSLTNQSFTFNTNDWLTSDSYDKNGNTTNSSGNSYQFDALNRLTNMNNGAVLITYNGDGARVKKTVGGVTTFYLVDDQNPSGYSQVLEEWTVSGGATNLSRVYNYGTRLINQRQPGVSTNYFVFDGRGSTRVLTDNGGNVVNAFAFDAYGNLIASNSAPQTAYLYCGQQWDSDLGMYYNRARYYQPGTGRFWTTDPQEGSVEDPPSLNRYVYCTDDPVNWADNTGEAPKGHHFLPQSIWDGRDADFDFSGDARRFFDSPEARTRPIPHNFTYPHSAYNEVARDEVKKFLSETGINPAAMTTDEARALLKSVRKNRFIKKFLLVVEEGPAALKTWVLDKGGYKLLPVHLQGKALEKQAVAKMAKKLGAALSRKVPLIGVGFTILMAERMHAQGYSGAEIRKAVIDDLLYNVPGMAEASANAVWDQADYIAQGAMNNAFGYMTLDFETEEFNGANGLITSDANVDAVLGRQTLHGHTVTAGDLIGAW